MKEEHSFSENFKHDTTGGKVTTIVSFVFFVILGLLSLIPFFANLIATFKPGKYLIQNGLDVSIDLSIMSFNNYIYLFTGNHKYFLWFWNSMFITIVQVVVVMFISAFVGYGFAAYKFKGKNLFFLLVLITMMVPFEILMLPLYKQIIAMNLIDTKIAIILPGIANASAIFFFRQYLVGVPKDIIDAGRVDGCNEYTIYFRLIMPIMKPAFAAMAILLGMGSWNNFVWPLLVFRTDTNFTLPIGLNALLTPYGNNYDLLIVGAFFSILPLFLLFVLFQRFFVSGLTAGAVKG